MLQPFRNEPYSDFDDPAAHAAFTAALARVEAALGEHAPLVIGPDQVGTRARIESIDPSRPERLVGVASSAGATGEKSASTVGGGALPGDVLPTWAVVLRPRHAARLASVLRGGDPPIVARVENDALWLDPRTVLPEEDEALLAGVTAGWEAST
jgi:Selenocysteine synthase [seryl-tRNASer selenium transferase]